MNWPSWFCPEMTMLPPTVSWWVSVESTIPSVMFTLDGEASTLRRHQPFTAAAVLPMFTLSPASGAPTGDQLAPVPQLPKSVSKFFTPAVATAAATRGMASGTRRGV